MDRLKLIGPFTQLLTMDELPDRGPITDDQIKIVANAGILVKGNIIESIGPFRELKSLTPIIEETGMICTAMPGFIDVHTHICWAGSRAVDYARRLSGWSYIKIAEEGGGIWSTVINTRQAGEEMLAHITAAHAEIMLMEGITTIEVKSGYGLNKDSELKMLRAIKQAGSLTKADLIPSCLAAHIKPKDFEGSAVQYLRYVVNEILPEVKAANLANRADIYIDHGAFDIDEGRFFMSEARDMGFDLSVHADQFSRGGLKLAVEFGAVSADHLEATSDEDIELIAASNVIPVALPGASLGLGSAFAPARKLLNKGTSLAIASDWNPGSAPMGKLLMQASVLGVYEKLTMAETLAAITCRAAPVLKLTDRGILKPGMLADFIIFPCNDYREIVYSQGAMPVAEVWKRGKRVKSNR
jgi:imidazolonepropionase